MNPLRIDWTAPEYAHRPKDVSWYWISIIVALLILGFAVWQSNYLFGFFVLVAEILVLIWGERPPRMIQFSISEKGLNIGENKFYPWRELKGFSVEEEGQTHLAWIDIAMFLENRIRPSTIICAPPEKVSGIRDALKTRLKEFPWEPSFLDTLERLFHF